MFRLLTRRNNDMDQLNYKLEREQMIRCIKNDLKAVDMKISLYVAACGGLPLQVIHPKPPGSSAGSVRNNQAVMLTDTDGIPSPERLLPLVSIVERQLLSPRAYSILKWLLLGLKEPKITSVSHEDFGRVLKKVVASDDNIAAALYPEEMFSLKPRSLSTMGQDWIAKTCFNETSSGFLPCNVEELHGLIYKGQLTKQLEPDGSVVLYTDLNYCVNIAPASWTWGKSNVGVSLKIVALVEFVDNPLHVLRDEIEVGHCDLGCVSLKNYKLLHPSYGRLKYLLVYPQQKRAKQRNPHTGQVPEPSVIQYAVAITWAVAMSLAYLLPRLQRSEPA